MTDATPESGGAAPPAVSVVVPTVGRPQSMSRLLAALARQDLAASAFEVIVVVNGPSAADFQLPRHGPDVTLLRRREPGRSGAANAGAAAARADVLVFLDDDMEPWPNWLRAHVEAHRIEGERLVLGPVPVAVTDRSGAASLHVARRFDRHLAKIRRPGYRIEPSDAYTGNASIRRATFEALGGFDDRLVEYGNEDRDLARRLVASGGVITVAPDAGAVQHYEKSLGQLLVDSRAKGRTAAKLVEIDRGAELDTRMRRRGSVRRRALRRVLTAAARVPGDRRLEAALVERVGRRSGLASPLIESLVDREFWTGVAEATANGSAEAGGDDPSPQTVVHLVDSVEFGGAEQVLVQLTRGLDRDRWRSIVIHDRRAVRLAGRLANAAIVGRARDLARLGRRRLDAVVGIVALARAIRAESPAIVHIHRPWPRSGRALFVAATLARPSAIVVTEHLITGRADVKRRLAERLLTGRVTRWIAVSPEVADGLTRRLGIAADRVEIVRNGVSPRPIARTRPRRDHVLVVAQLRPQKGHLTLIDAAARLPERITVTLAGDGPERAAIERRIGELGLAERVNLAGFVDDVGPLLDAASVVVLPSRFEGFPLVVLEAMAAGRPVVATDVPGTNELITDGETGLLVPVDDPVRLATAIQRLLDDPAEAEQMGARARARVTERFGVDRMASAVDDIYRAVLVSDRTSASRHETRLDREAALDRALRRIDLRVLARTPAPARAAASGRDAAQLEAALAIVAGEVVLTGPSDDVRPDLIVLDRATPAEVDVARRRVAADGDLLLLSPAALGRSSRSAIAASSASVVYRPWPLLGRPRAWLPAGDRQALHDAVDRSLGRNRLRNVARRVDTWAWRVMGRVGRAPLAVIVDAADHGPWSSTHPGFAPEGDERSWTVLTGGSRSHNRIVAVGRRRGEREPSLVATIARAPSSVAGLQREAAALEALARDSVDGVPRLVGVVGDGLGTVVLQTAINGLRVSRVASTETFGRLATAIGDWTASLVRPERQVDAAVALGPLVERFGAEFRDVDPSLVDRLARAVAEIGMVPGAIEHRDLAPWNLRIERSGALAVLDWESASIDGIAGPDVHYALAHLLFDVSGATRTDDQVRAYRRALDPTTTLGAVIDRVIREYGARAGMGYAAMTRLACATWAIHAHSEFDRLAGDVGGRPSLHELRRSRFVGLLRADLERLESAVTTRGRNPRPD